MNKHQIRKERMRLKSERRAILRQIDELQIELKQAIDTSELKRLNIEIARLGELLKQKVVNNISDHSYVDDELFSEIGGEWEYTKNVAWSMPYNEYIKFKKQELTDAKIAEMVGATYGQVIAWKHRNGITRSHWQEAN